ncbi:hypothetical protein [Amycolatopsis sp. NPDC004378]
MVEPSNEVNDLTVELEHTREALSTQAVIEQAKGMLRGILAV